MFDDSERQWLHNPETGGYFHCPAEAVDAWKGRGWEESGPPEDIDPARAARLAFEADQEASEKASKAAKADAVKADDEPAPKTPSKATKPAAAKTEEK